MRKDSIKYERLNDEFMREVSRILHRDIKDPRIHPMTSVLSTDISPDLHSAVVYVSVFGDDNEKKRTAEGLKSAAPRIRRLLAKNMNLRITPELRFVVDDTIEYESAMAQKIAALKAEAADAAADEADTEGEENE